MDPLTIGIVAIIAGASGLWIAKRLRPNALVMYTAEGAGAPEFLRNARLAEQALGVTAVPIRSGQDILNALYRAPQRLGVVILIGHGTANAFFRPGATGLRLGNDSLPTWLSTRTFAQLLARKATTAPIITLAGCRAGALSSEPDWSATTAGPGGAQSLAGQLRDELVRQGMPGGEIRAHSTTGGVLANPSGRVFWIDRYSAGRSGAALQDLALGQNSSRDESLTRTWNTRVRGELATRWALGGGAPKRIEVLG